MPFTTEEFRQSRQGHKYQSLQQPKLPLESAPAKLIFFVDNRIRHRLYLSSLYVLTTTFFLFDEDFFLVIMMRPKTTSMLAMLVVVMVETVLGSFLEPSPVLRPTRAIGEEGVEIEIHSECPFAPFTPFDIAALDLPLQSGLVAKNSDDEAITRPGATDDMSLVRYWFYDASKYAHVPEELLEDSVAWFVSILKDVLKDPPMQWSRYARRSYSDEWQYDVKEGIVEDAGDIVEEWEMVSGGFDLRQYASEKGLRDFPLAASGRAAVAEEDLPSMWFRFLNLRTCDGETEVRLQRGLLSETQGNEYVESHGGHGPQGRFLHSHLVEVRRDASRAASPDAESAFPDLPVFAGPSQRISFQQYDAERVRPIPGVLYTNAAGLTFRAQYDGKGRFDYWHMYAALVTGYTRRSVAQIRGEEVGCCGCFGSAGPKGVSRFELEKAFPIWPVGLEAGGEVDQNTTTASARPKKAAPGGCFQFMDCLR